MGFYKPGANHTSDPKMARLHKVIWALIFGGLLMGIVGIFVADADRLIGGVMVASGAVLTLAGAVLIYVRSTLPEA